MHDGHACTVGARVAAGQLAAAASKGPFTGFNSERMLAQVAIIGRSTAAHPASQLLGTFDSHLGRGNGVQCHSHGIVKLESETRMTAALAQNDSIA